MTLRQLRYFLEIAQLRSFTRASEVLHIAQSALSRQIHALEDELGVPLFKRFDRGVTLTEAGELLRDRAHQLLTNFDQLREEVIERAEEPRGAVRIGLPPSLREMVNVPLVSGYTARYPMARLHVHEGISLELSQLVENGRLDCALVIALDATHATEAEHLLSEPLYLVGPRAAGLALDTAVTPEDVAARELILTTRPNSLRLIVENALAGARRPLAIIADFNSTGLMVELVAQGMAFSVLPYSAVWAGLRRGELSIAPIVGVEIDWVMISPAARGLSLAARKLCELAREVAAQQIACGNWTGARLHSIS
jgi:LysR family nitrogen assimilation transcriptional regulator